MVLESSYSCDANTMSRDHILPLPSTPFFTPFFRSLPRYDSSRPRAMAYSVPCVAPLQRVLCVYKLLHSSLSIESIVFSHTKLLQLRTDSTRAPIAVPTVI